MACKAIRFQAALGSQTREAVAINEMLRADLCPHVSKVTSARPAHQSACGVLTARVALLWVSNISWPIVTHLYVPQAKRGRQSFFPADKSKPLNYGGVQATWIPLHACHGFEGVYGLQNVLAVFLLDSGYAAWGVVVAEMPALLLMSCPFF